MRMFNGIVVTMFLAAAGLGTARADHDRDRDRGEPEIFIPHSSFRFEDGYYRTNRGHNYHYDRDREGWHYGRDHREGMRWEEKHRH